MSSEAIETILVSNPFRPGENMYVNSDDPGLLDGTYKKVIVKESDLDVEDEDDSDDLEEDEEDEEDEDEEDDEDDEDE